MVEGNQPKNDESSSTKLSTVNKPSNTKHAESKSQASQKEASVEKNINTSGEGCFSQLEHLWAPVKFFEEAGTLATILYSGYAAVMYLNNEGFVPLWNSIVIIISLSIIIICFSWLLKRSQNG